MKIVFKLIKIVFKLNDIFAQVPLRNSSEGGVKKDGNKTQKEKETEKNVRNTSSPHVGPAKDVSVSIVDERDFYYDPDASARSFHLDSNTLHPNTSITTKLGFEPPKEFLRQNGHNGPTTPVRLSHEVMSPALPGQSSSRRSPAAFKGHMGTHRHTMGVPSPLGMPGNPLGMPLPTPDFPATNSLEPFPTNLQYHSLESLQQYGNASEEIQLIRHLSADADNVNNVNVNYASTKNTSL